MNAAQMLAAAGEPNTTAGRAKFHQRFKNKQAFDVWYNSKKQYGGGLTDEIAFPQQPMASYAYGGASAKQFFAPNYMPFNGPIGFYEHGGLHKYQDAGQVPQFLGRDRDNYYAERDRAAVLGEQNFGDQGFDYEGPITNPGVPPVMPPIKVPPTIGGTPPMPPINLPPIQRPPVGGDPIPPFKKKKPSGGGSSHHHPSMGDQLGRWWQKNFQGRGRGHKYDVARCWKGKCHEYGGMTDGIAFPQQPTEHINFSAFPWQPQYDMGGMNYNMGGLPMNDNGEPCYECGGYMQTGGTTQMDQGQYTNDMTQEYLKSLADFSMAARPMPMGNVQEAGYAAYGTVVDNNQMSDFNTLDMNNVNNTSLRETELDKLKNNRSNTFTNLLNVPANMAANTYLKKPTYTTQTVGSGMINTNEEPNADGRLTQSQIANWEPTQNSMYARYGGNMFRNGGLNKYAPGGTSIPGYTDEEVAESDEWFAKQVAESAANEAKNNYYKQISGNTAGSNSGTNQGTTAGNTAGTTTNTNVGNTNDNTMGDTRMTADELAYFRGMMRGSNQGNYAPSWQAQQNQNNGYDAWKAMSRDPEALKKFLSNSGIQDMKWNNKMGMFGPKSKGHITFRTYYDPSTGKTVSAPVDQAAASGQSGTTQPGAGQQMQKGPKGAGFIKNLIAKNKQRKADKQATRDQALKDQQFANSRIAQATPGTTDPVNYFGQNFENNNRLSPGMQAELSKGQRMPLTGDERKKQFFDNRLDQDTDRPSPTPQGSIPYYPGSEPIGFEYGGFPQYGYGGYSQYGYGGAPQYNYGGYPEYEEGAELDMSPEEIENYLAMGGTLEYLD